MWGHTRRNLIEYFGEGKNLRDITQGDAEEWRLYLLHDQKLASNTVRRRSGMAKQIFRAAIRRKLISDNPFSDLPAAVGGNAERQYFVSREEADRVLAACPDVEWRVLFALSRFGGFRCPSEHLRLRWQDIDWAQNRLTVHSPKTEHHEGKASRLLPLFPELRTHLFDLWEAAPEGAEYVITRYRGTNSNMRTTLSKIIKRAGLNPWPKLFHNLRATRQTELQEEFPSHVVCSWIGNTQSIAQKHYLQVTEDHFEQAAGGAKSGAVDRQNAVQREAAPNRTVSQGNPQVVRRKKDTPPRAIRCGVLQRQKLGDEGLEPPTSCV
ncbi:tyrosine-type recombinase/integrase [Stratiformator vulcanicus]|uniref:tyrosine-type recombinase/integrase n=1 Tax=Stratiformator vulcanicus TaxID=2527980 RepID=UPI0035C6E520